MRFFIIMWMFFMLTIAHAKRDMCRQANSLAGGEDAMCMGYMKQWSYDDAKNACIEFVYGGCGGNDNRFGTQTECESACKS